MPLGHLAQSCSLCLFFDSLNKMLLYPPKITLVSKAFSHGAHALPESPRNAWQKKEENKGWLQHAQS